jgi:hypothetical protein
MNRVERRRCSYLAADLFSLVAALVKPTMRAAAAAVMGAQPHSTASFVSYFSSYGKWRALGVLMIVSSWSMHAW